MVIGAEMFISKLSILNYPVAISHKSYKCTQARRNLLAYPNVFLVPVKRSLSISVFTLPTETLSGSGKYFCN